MPTIKALGFHMSCNFTRKCDVGTRALVDRNSKKLNEQEYGVLTLTCQPLINGLMIVHTLSYIADCQHPSTILTAFNRDGEKFITLVRY